jgi:hypothetical protein
MNDLVVSVSAVLLLGFLVLLLWRQGTDQSRVLML